MSQPITLERIGLLGALKFGFVLGAFFALVGAFFSFLFYLWLRVQLAQLPFFAPSPFNPTPLVPLPEIPTVLLTLLVYVILGAVLYGISVWLLAVIYNFVAAFSGGLIFHIKGMNLASPAALPLIVPAAVAPLYNPQSPANAVPVPQSPQPAVSPQPASVNPIPAAISQAPAVQGGAWFIGVSNPALRVALTRPVTRIGSAPGNDLVVTSPRVAAHHAEIRLENGRYIVYDVSNGIGVTVNGRAIQQSNMLKNGFNVALGDATFVFQQ